MIFNSHLFQIVLAHVFCGVFVLTQHSIRLIKHRVSKHVEATVWKKIEDFGIKDEVLQQKSDSS